MTNPYKFYSPLFKSVLFVLAIVLSLPGLSYAQGNCDCTNCPQFMPDNFTGSFLINVQNASNPTLGQNGQGVCGVVLDFDHEYLGDLQIVLTAPNGSSVTLVGPIGFFGPTDFTTWNVTFLPCGDSPTPDAGFNQTWNNNQAWGLGGAYTGSYFPYNGCLENLTGPVNGTWSLTVTDGQAIDVGNFYDYEIIFCDPAGIDCFSCAANAGNLLQADVSACEGSSNLSLNLPPSYPANVDPPPASDYSYTYVIAGAGGVIQAYEPSPDLSTYPPGNYTVCGMSYLSAQEGDIPAPNGSLTITQLTTQLNSSMPPFCGKITTNCVNVTVFAGVEDEEESVEICSPQCYVFHNQTYCQTGTYVRNLTTPQGCPYVATLNLTVLLSTFNSVNEYVCAGECSTTPGFENACSQGTYLEHFTNEAGCDSLVTLHLNVLSATANIVPPPNIGCSGNIQLQGTGSSTGAGITYLWTASNGGTIVGPVNGLNAMVSTVGDYELRVCRTTGGVTCCDSAMTTVTGNQNLPPAPAAVTGTNSICNGQTASFSIAAVSGATGYTWTVPAGVVITSGQNTTNIDVTWNSPAGGSVCVTANNACGSSPQTCLTVNIGPTPVATMPQGNNAVCNGANSNYSIPAVPNATIYNWSVTAPATITAGQGTPQITVNWNGGTSGNVCVNAGNACGNSATVCLPVQITSAPASPAVTGSSTVCAGDTGSYSFTAVAGATAYNWIATNGTVVSGNGTTSVQVAWDANAASGTVCAVASNICGNSMPACFNVTIGSIPAAGPITPDCDGTNQNFTVSFPIVGGVAPYTIPGGTIAGGVFTSNLLANGQNYSFVITDANGCVSPAVTGTHNCLCATSAGTMNLAQLQACENQTVTATNNSDGTLDANDIGAYVLHTNSGTSLGTVLAQNTTGTFGFQAGMNYGQTYYVSFVVGNNVAGMPDPVDPCFSVSQGQPVVFDQIPVANAGLDADTCGLVLNLSGNTGVGSGSWTVATAPPGGNLTLADPQSATSTATADLAGAYTLTWTLDNNGCTATDQVGLSFNESPASDTVTTDCDGTNQNFTVTFPISGGTAPYSVNGSPVAGSTFTSAPIANSGTYNFTVTDANGCAAPVVTGSFSCNCATNAGQMDLTPLAACEGATITAQHLGGQNLDANDTTAFVLHTGAGAALGTLLAQNATGVFGFQAGMTYGQTYYVSYVVGNNVAGAPDPNDPCFVVAPGQPVVFNQNPLPDAGANDATCGNALTLNGNAGTGTGLWTVTGTPAGGNLTLNDPQDPATDVSASAFGTYTLTWTVTENGCTGTDQVDLQFNELPALVDLVRDCDPANENFTVTLEISGGTPPYSVNGSIFGGSTFVSNPFPNGQTYTFAVLDANGCSMLDVSGAYSCNCATNAGTMDLLQLTACEDGTVTAQANNDQTLDGNDVVGFVLHTGTNAALGTVLDQNASGTFGFLPGMTYGTTYYISRVAGNALAGVPDPLDPCFSVAPGQPVQFLKNPTPNAGVDAVVCGQTIDLQAVNDNFGGNWSQVSGTGTSSFGAPTQPGSSVTVNVTGDYVFSWTEVNGGCTGVDEVNITFNELPAVGAIAENCDGTNTNYVISFPVSGGAPAYTVTGLGGSFSGNVFTSVPVLSNGTYAITVTDNFGCSAAPVAGSHNCNCTTDAGTMQVAPLVFCGDEPAVAVWNNDPQLDGNDVVRFILHNQAANSVGTVFGTNNQPSFFFNTGLQYGVTYYISAIAGDGQIGGVNLNDPCLSVASGTPVQWKPVPTATLAGNAALCNGEGANLTFSGTGEFPLTLTYTDDQGGQNTLTLNDNQPVNVPVQPSVTTIYTLVSATDNTTPTCAIEPNTIAQISISQPVESGDAAAALEICAGQNTVVQLGTLLIGADAGGVWTETSSNPSQGGAFNAPTGTFQIVSQVPATYAFSYHLDAAAPCPDGTTAVSVIVEPQAVADAGPDLTLDCIEIAAVLGGAGTSTGSDVGYTWLLNGDTLSGATGSQLETSKGGIFTLLVNNTAGCPDEDVTVVTLDNEAPQAAAIRVDSVRCFGDTNGAIFVDSVSGGQPPVLYSLNNSPFGGSSVYSGLPPGYYVVTLQGANGCQWSSDTLEVGEPDQLIAALGPDIQVSLGDMVQLEAATSLPLTELDTIIWNPLLDTAQAGTPYQEFLPLRSWQVGVTVTDLNGCKANDRLEVIVDRHRHVFIPNIIAPAGSENSILTIYGGQDVVEIESFQLYDRWGERIFEAFNFQPEAESWNGRFRGADVLPGVYIYYAVIRFIDGESEIFTGDVTVYR